MHLIDKRRYEHTYVLKWQDHLKKTVFLRPLKGKRAEEVARALLVIFTKIGVTSILQSNNGIEFANSIFTVFKGMWSE